MARIQRIVLAVVILFFCTGFDQITKDVAREKLAASPPISLLDDTIRIEYSENTGAILGIGANLPDDVRFALFVLLSGLISIMALFVALKVHDLRFIQLLGLLLIASGGLGNLLDRLLNQGAAIDFLNIGIGSIRTGIFNVADVLIIAGATLLMLSSLKDRTKATLA
jgi:signal peptidase II